MSWRNYKARRRSWRRRRMTERAKGKRVTGKKGNRQKKNPLRQHVGGFSFPVIMWLLEVSS